MDLLLYLVDSGRILLGLVFLCSVAGKLRTAHAFRLFRDGVGRLVPRLRRWKAPVAVLVVAAELSTVAALAVPGTTVLGFGLAAGLLLAFTAGLVGALRREALVSCHCFGPRGDTVALRHVVRNAVLVGVTLACLAARLAAPGAGAAPSPWLLLAGGVAVLLALLIVVMDDLASLFRPRPPSTAVPSGATAAHAVRPPGPVPGTAEVVR
ncbi:MauE/DoxX family redox-associated membrane protein [Streptomyces marokkonensis]|uniref:MauE/DoxX family redox-associated membrane protein n=1 Tax=Streptomyces marokkonensis TaxID=324855 RepID=UPI00142EBF49|nr:MauE/DoxX family redox-associated membrane protein [Streptomyces marokkonensis]